MGKYPKALQFLQDAHSTYRGPGDARGMASTRLSIGRSAFALLRSYDWLRALCRRAQHFHGALCIAMVGIDHFKRVNDVHGHAAGDQVLIEVARPLRSALRSGHLVARRGGEAFAVLLPHATTNEAVIRPEQLREAVAESSIAINAKHVKLQKVVATSPVRFPKSCWLRIVQFQTRCERSLVSAPAIWSLATQSRKYFVARDFVNSAGSCLSSPAHQSVVMPFQPDRHFSCSPSHARTRSRRHLRQPAHYATEPARPDLTISASCGQ